MDPCNSCMYGHRRRIYSDPNRHQNRQIYRSLLGKMAPAMVGSSTGECDECLDADMHLRMRLCQLSGSKPCIPFWALKEKWRMNRVIVKNV